jgi:hypothetical protein
MKDENLKGNTKESFKDSGKRWRFYFHTKTKQKRKKHCAQIQKTFTLTSQGKNCNQRRENVKVGNQVSRQRPHFLKVFTSLQKGKTEN